uniref:Uncharacterized protein MANES_09G007600 n=1 Tax=Rhizophora mucronata TaxID=61149 RepID=A0A2P2JFZ1_RHIMU
MERNGMHVGGEALGNGSTLDEMGTLGGCLGSYLDEGNVVETRRCYLAWRTVLEMLKDRGYSVPSSEIDISLPKFQAIYGQDPDFDRLKFSATHLSDHYKRILVIFCGAALVKVSTIRFIAGQIANRESLTGLILILRKEITSQARKAVNLFSFKVEVFQVCFLISMLFRFSLCIYVAKLWP